MSQCKLLQARLKSDTEYSGRWKKSKAMTALNFDVPMLATVRNLYFLKGEFLLRVGRSQVRRVD